MKLWQKSLYTGFVLLLAGTAFTVMVTSATFLYLTPQLPEVEALQDIKFQTPLRIYSQEGLLISEFGEKRRIPVQFGQIPPLFIDALLAAEDQRFYQHSGVDIKGLARAVKELILTGSIRSGGSTITMQVARNFFLTRNQTFIRKFNEILLALQIESLLEKNDILSLYVNKIYLGHRAYGIGAAAQVYYGRPLSELTVSELAMIAGLPKAPSRYNPITNPERAKTRRNWILGRMHQLNYIDAATLETAQLAEVTASSHGLSQELSAPYLAEMVRQDLLERYGNRIYEDGFNVKTTIDGQLQNKAQAAVINGLVDYDQRHGFRGPEGRADEKALKTLLSNPSTADQDALRSIFKNYYNIGFLKPALVTKVIPTQATIMLENGHQAVIPLSNATWARRYISANRLGNEITDLTELLHVGDMIRATFPDATSPEPGAQTAASADETAPEQMTALPEAHLSQVPQAQAALVSLSPDDGRVLSIIGGIDFRISKFNRATQAARQVGSSIKPFIYSAALEAGFSAASLINDAPLVFNDKHLESAWRPENSSGKFNGPTRLRQALYESRNLVSIRLLQELGVNRAIKTLTHYGFAPQTLPPNLSLALGAAAMTPMDIATRYASLANGGFKVEPYYIEQIRDAQGELIYKHNPIKVCADCPEESDTTAGQEQASQSAFSKAMNEALGEPAADRQAPPPASVQQVPLAAPRVMNKQEWYIIRSMMGDVIARGTGRRAKTLGRSDLAGKTGTTNDQKDGWFNGFNADVTTTVWVGFDDPSTLGNREYGGSVALPIWIDYMATALQKSPDRLPPAPAGLISVRIDPETGLRAQPGQRDAIFEYFRPENVPPLPSSNRQATEGPKEDTRLEDIF